MRILATGGAGYVGSSCVRALLRRGHECFVYDNLSTGYPQAVPEDRLLVGDLNHRKMLTGILREKKIEAVMHFAASIAVGESVEKPRLYYRNNITHSLNLLEAMQDAGVNKILFSSTAAVYSPSAKPLYEYSKTDPVSPYAFSKYAIERMIMDFFRAYGLGYTILRYFNACGASPDGHFGEAHHPETHLIPLVLQVPLGQRDCIRVFGSDYDTPDGTCIRDYIHVDDLADAHIRAVESVTAGKGTVFNIGTGSGNSVLEVIRAAEDVVGEKIKIEFVDRRPGDTARLVAASDQLREKLQWQPKYDNLHDIIASAWNWHRNYPQGYVNHDS